MLASTDSLRANIGIIKLLPPSCIHQEKNAKMSCSLKDERYVNIDDSKFGTKRGVSTAKDQDTGEIVMVKGIHLRSNQQWQDAREEAENIKTLGI